MPMEKWITIKLFRKMMIKKKQDMLAIKRINKKMSFDNCQFIT
jgi:hypothetical protein